ncbi:ATP-binding cassette domain-containing protein [Nocardia sp. NPDC050408]|uniref:ATP-binding cassette domain-containing protein n=1 Tax=Nocardia sp. NPDC050408 TaxID=3364319 RepID=UPI0037989546
MARRGGRAAVADLRQMWGLLELSPWRVAVAIGWGVLALGSGLGLAALAAWLIARAWEMPPVLDLSVAVVAVRALGISRGLCRYLERLATHDVALRAMTAARTTVYRTLAQSDAWMRRDARGGDIDGAVYTGGTSMHGLSRRSGEVTSFGPENISDRSVDGPVAATDSTSADGAASLRRGDLLVRIGSDIDDLGAVVVRVFVPIAVAIVLALAAVGLMATISVGAAAILAVSLGIAGIVAPWLSGWAARAAERAVRADRAEFTAQALTVLDHAAELRVAGKLDAALAAADRAGQRAVAAEDSAAARSAWAAAATPLSIGVSVLGALLIGIAGYGANPPAMTPMALTILVLLPLSAFEAVAPLPAAAQALTTARAALHRLPLLEIATRNPMAQQHSRTSGRVDAVIRGGPGLLPASATGCTEGSGCGIAGSSPEGLTWASDRPGVDADIRDARNLLPVNLPERPAGKRIAVVGPSGAGKTTLLMAWAGLFSTPAPGVTFFAEDAHIFGTSVLENLRVARGDLTAEAAEKALCVVGLGNWLESLPDGVHTDLVGGAAAVSGGQRRRILLARALLSPARVLLLDEPTEHLEAEAGARLLRELLDVDSGLVGPDRIVVVVTHQLPADHRAEVVLQIDASGQVTTIGEVEEHTGSAPREIPLPTY